MTATIPPLKVLFFDVFGTVVAQRKPVADALWKATKEALQSKDLSISDEVRTKATVMSYEDWIEFGVEWDKEVDKFIKSSIQTHNTVDWHAVDAYRLTSLHHLLASRGLLHLNQPPAADLTTSFPPSSLSIKSGSLFTTPHLHSLSKIWHLLPPHPDTIPGLHLLNKKYSTVTLSNAQNALTSSIVSHSSIPFKHIYTADMWDSFKPDPKVYLGAAEKMGVRPEECALVAAHLGDLKGAKKCGFWGIYVEREGEEKMPELRGEGIPDLVVGVGEGVEGREEMGGFVELARRLGIRS